MKPPPEPEQPQTLEAERWRVEAVNNDKEEFGWYICVEKNMVIWTEHKAEAFAVMRAHNQALSSLRGENQRLRDLLLLDNPEPSGPSTYTQQSEEIEHLRSRLAIQQGLLNEICQSHCYKDSSDYNECEIAPCCFCEQVASLAQSEGKKGLTEIRLWLSGIPAPGGSKNAFPVYSKGRLVLKDGRPIIRMVDAGGKANAAWKKAVSLQAFAQFKQAPWTCPISVEFHFVMPRPKYHFGTGKNAERLKDDAPTFHTVKPDLTKLIRSTEDALTGRLWVDDAQICSQVASKRYGSNPGVWISMRQAGLPPEL